MAVPSPTGNRLAIVVGSGLSGDVLGETAEVVELTVEGFGGDPVVVPIEDCGNYLVLRRHGRDWSRPAHRLDHHANIRALCAAGCDRVLALSSVGSLRSDWPAGTMVAPDDFLAFDAYPSFHDDTGGHLVPGFDPGWRATVVAAWQEAASTDVVDGGVYAQTRGPRFETKAEVRMLASNADVVGMTVASECILAREAGVAYAAVCKVDNLANGIGERDLTVDEFLEGGASTARRLADDVRSVVAALAGRP